MAKFRKTQRNNFNPENRESRLNFTDQRFAQARTPRERLSFIVGGTRIPYQLDSLLWRHNEPAISSIVDIIPGAVVSLGPGPAALSAGVFLSTFRLRLRG